MRLSSMLRECTSSILENCKPEERRCYDGASVPLKHAHDIYVARTYAYVANGEDGIAIIDVERPESPRLDQTFNAEGTINDAHPSRSR